MQQLEEQLQQVEADCAQLRLRNEQLERAKSEAAQERTGQLARCGGPGVRLGSA